MYEQEITKGMAVLDEHEPGWDTRINVTMLDMESGWFPMNESLCGCILAQAATTDHADGYFRSHASQLFAKVYGHTEERFGEVELFAVKHGFLLGDKASQESYMQLTLEWKRALMERWNSSERSN